MKIKFYRNIRTMSGLDKQANMVFSSYKNDQICIARNYVYPTLTDNNALFGQKIKAAANLFKTLSVEFIGDLVKYAHCYNYQHRKVDEMNLTGYNIYMKVIMSLSNVISDKEELGNSVGVTVAEWINNNKLPAVVTSESLNNLL